MLSHFGTDAPIADQIGCIEPRLRRPLLRVLSFIAAGVVVAAGTSSAQTRLASEDVDRIGRAVVRVVVLQGGEEVSSGSGTVVEAGGRIYTNRHVIDGGEDYAIEVLEDPNELPVLRYRARLVGFSTEVDFAVLQIDRDDRGEKIAADRIDLPFLSSTADEARRGDGIFVFGYPDLGEGYLTYTEGTVTTIRNGAVSDRRVPVWFQTDAQVAPGNSGGLAVNARGEMVGIPTQVRTEEQTGGRLGGILALNAVNAALNNGLETDVSRMPNAPAFGGNALNVDEPPLYGSATLASGFEPDPHTLAVEAGGEVATGYLGEECTGYAAGAADFRLHWSGASSELRIFFVADDDVDDATLLVRFPDGSWACNDDADGPTLNPMAVFRDPLPGQYDIWVGTVYADRILPGTLHVTEGDLGPTSAGLTAGGDAELDHTAEPAFGSVALRAGFTPNPDLTDVRGGGSVDASYLGGDCVGYAASAPDVRLTWSGASNWLRIFFNVDESGDAALLVSLPDGTWACNDDAGSLDPSITLEDPAEGQYAIWIGSLGPNRYIDGALGFERPVYAPGSDGVALDFEEAPSYGSAALASGFDPDPHTLGILAGGEVATGYLGGECTGYTGVAPDFRMHWSGTSAELRIFVVADGDTTLLIRLPDGSWACNDDADGTTLNPMVAFHDPLPGPYVIWLGTYEANESVPGTLHLTERDLGPTSVGAPGGGDAELD